MTAVHPVRAAAVLVLAVLATALVTAAPAFANHPVFVEGSCFGPGAGASATGLQTSPVPPGTCGDYDGDGNIGEAEDMDGDNNYGTINAALAAVAQNGRVTIVANGTFPEIVTINPANGGNVSLEGAPGVDANIDAVVQGEPGGADRANSPGIIIDGCSRCRVTVRNVMTRNWTDGVLVRGQSHAHLDELRAENNLNYGVHVVDRARVSISNSQVNASGFRTSAAGVGRANPGTGISYEDASMGSIYWTSVTGSAAAGVEVNDQRSSGRGGYSRGHRQGSNVELFEVQLFDNNPNFRGSRRR